MLWPNIIAKQLFLVAVLTYGSKSINPISENYSIKPENPYGVTKASIEKILNDLYISSQWNGGLLI